MEFDSAVGLGSLFLGAISLILTLCTLINTKKIKIAVNEAVKKERFEMIKPELLLNLQQCVDIIHSTNVRPIKNQQFYYLYFQVIMKMEALYAGTDNMSLHTRILNLKRHSTSLAQFLDAKPGLSERTQEQIENRQQEIVEHEKQRLLKCIAELQSILEVKPI